MSGEGQSPMCNLPPLIQSEIGAPLRKHSLVIKRGCDLILSSVGLVLSLPLITGFAVAIKWTSPGPIFFQQQRVGLQGRPLTIVKLRSMRPNSEATTGAVWARPDDQRITPVGRIMRRFRIDELPQLWNVLCGQMSLIGPRPERPQLTVQFSLTDPQFPRRLRILPGLTGYAQVHGGYELTPKQKECLDNYYIDHYSLWLDGKILLATIRVILTGAGAR